MSAISRLIIRAKRLARELINMFSKTESMSESKKKWNTLADKNASYYIMTDYGEDITPEQFRATGQKDCRELIENDQILRAKLSPFKEKDLLEIGCGTGRISEFEAKIFKNVTGIDISEGMISQATKRLSHLTNVKFVATDGRRYPFANNSFDVVFSFIVFQHMPGKETVMSNISELSRVLRPSGIAKIQLRGIPTSKKHWFYGPSFTTKQVQSMIKNLPLSIVKSEAEGERYFWIWLEKTNVIA